MSLFFFWLKQWVRFYILKSLGFCIIEIDFGDRFFRRMHEGKELRQKQYIHIASIKEVEKQIKAVGFNLVEKKLMGEISNSDGKKMKASLSKGFNSFKSPVFYICQKP